MVIHSIKYMSAFMNIECHLLWQLDALIVFLTKSVISWCRCGLQRQNTMNQGRRLFTGSASNRSNGRAGKELIKHSFFFHYQAWIWANYYQDYSFSLLVCRKLWIVIDLVWFDHKLFHHFLPCYLIKRMGIFSLWHTQLTR